jgi:hypothetical protein
MHRTCASDVHCVKLEAPASITRALVLVRATMLKKLARRTVRATLCLFKHRFSPTERVLDAS